MKKLFLFGAILALTVSCTPEQTIEDPNNEQSIDKDKYQVPPNG